MAMSGLYDELGGYGRAGDAGPRQGRGNAKVIPREV